jgi:hypothetical protein
MFLGWALTLRSTVCQWFDLKTTETVFSGLASKLVVTVFSGLVSKSVVTVSWLSLKIKVVEGFLVLASKPVPTVWWFGPQNHRDGFLVWASKLSKLWFVGCATKSTGGCDGVGHASRFKGLLHVEATLARVFQSDLKTDECAMTGGAPVWRQTGRYNRLRRTLLPLLYRFHSIRS